MHERWHEGMRDISMRGMESTRGMKIMKYMRGNKDTQPQIQQCTHIHISIDIHMCPHSYTVPQT